MMKYTFEELTNLQTLVRVSQDTDKRRGDTEATAKLVEKLNLKTLDGAPIRVGMRVVDYNMRWTTIVGIQSIDMHSGVWFATANGGMFDAGRLWARMP